MTTKEILIEARKRIERPECWTQHRFQDGDAYCMSGAFFACHAAGPGAIGEALGHLHAIVGGRSVASWNDDPRRTHAEVLAAFDRAIESAS